MSVLRPDSGSVATFPHPAKVVPPAQTADGTLTFKMPQATTAPPAPTVMEHNMAELITDLTHEESEIVQWKILTEWLRDLGIAVEEER